MNEQQRQRPDHHDDDGQWISIHSILFYDIHVPADDDTKILLQKAWCHGQSIAPPILGGLVVFISGHNDNPSWFASVPVLAIVMSWPVVSLRRILVGGAVLLALYAYMLGTILHWHSDGQSSSGVAVIFLVFLSLMVVETIAYLVGLPPRRHRLVLHPAGITVQSRQHPAPRRRGGDRRGEEVQERQVGRSVADAGGEGRGRRRAGGRRPTDHGGGPDGPGQAVGGRAEPRHGHHRGRELDVATSMYKSERHPL